MLWHALACSGLLWLALACAGLLWLADWLCYAPGAGSRGRQWGDLKRAGHGRRCA